MAVERPGRHHFQLHGLFRRTVPVLPGGTINFPYAGSLQVAGQSPTAIGSRISQSLSGVLASPPTVFV
ncbi:MAG: polysaccharide biosynthesis/export family protein, partial [Pannonibacter phragmitetus]